jgi:hypothetical protein
MKPCLNETYRKGQIINILSDTFPIRNDNKEICLSPLSLIFALEPLGRSKKPRRDWNWLGHIHFWCALMAFL